jgi:hypothetical protein
MHYEEIELNFDPSCQQILGLESEILWEASSTPTLTTILLTTIPLHPNVQSALDEATEPWGIKVERVEM